MHTLTTKFAFIFVVFLLSLVADESSDTLLDLLNASLVTKQTVPLPLEGHKSATVAVHNGLLLLQLPLGLGRRLASVLDPVGRKPRRKRANPLARAIARQSLIHGSYSASFSSTRFLMLFARTSHGAAERGGDVSAKMLAREYTRSRNGVQAAHRDCHQLSRG